MNRRELLRNSLLTFGAAATVSVPVEALVFASGEDASRDLARPNWKPAFLSANQNETLIMLSETIIPATDTPGAKEALVNRFLDLILSALPATTQQEFLESLAWFDTGSMARYKVPFASLSDGDREDFMNLVAWPHTHVMWQQSEAGFPGFEHFSRLKRWIAAAYYSSPAGFKEQGWDGWPARGALRGCEHQPEERQSDKQGAKPGEI
jgi:hypothetical protein